MSVVNINKNNILSPPPSPLSNNVKVEEENLKITGNKKKIYTITYLCYTK